MTLQEQLQMLLAQQEELQFEMADLAARSEILKSAIETIENRLEEEGELPALLPGLAQRVPEVEALIAGVDSMQRPCESGLFILPGVDTEDLPADLVRDYGYNIKWASFMKASQAHQTADRGDIRKLHFWPAKDYPNTPHGYAPIGLLHQDGVQIYVFIGTREELIAKVQEWRNALDAMGPVDYPLGRAAWKMDPVNPHGPNAGEVRQRFED